MYNAAVAKSEAIILSQRIEREFLPVVGRPGRYIGGEINQKSKDLSGCELTVALCFPDTYEVGMSHTGLGIIYDVLNKMPNVAAERAFAPWTDAEEILREKHIPLFTLESKAALRDFGVIGFSLTSELCYTNVLNMLDLAMLEVRSEGRGQSDPIVIAGGGMANCCEPIAPFIDLFVLGEAENAVVELANLIIENKKKGASKNDILLAAAREFDWVYVPAFYEFRYDGDRIASFGPKVRGLRTEFSSAVVDDFENAPVPARPIVPYVQAVHERVSVEIMRGCRWRCRFCQASFCRRPVRYRSVQRIVDIAKTAYHATGFDTVSLLSLSTADYPNLEQLIDELHGYFAEKNVGLSLPSLRVDRQLKLLPKLVTSVRKSGLTIAVEAASEKLRQVVNKPLKDEDLFAAVEAAYKAGYQKLKLYFMVGHPGESDEDIAAIVRLSDDLARLRKAIDGKVGQIKTAVSWLVPKPHTPFSWLGQRPAEYFEKARELILGEKKRLRAKYLQFKFHDVRQSQLESAVGRGDRRLADVIEAAWQSGAKFDLWTEHFSAEVWAKAFEENGLNLEAEAQKRFDFEQVLPWEHLGGPGKAYLLKHLSDALQTVARGTGPGTRVRS